MLNSRDFNDFHGIGYLRWLPAIVVTSLLAITFICYAIASKVDRQGDRTHLDRMSAEVLRLVEGRLETYSAMLQGVAGYFSATSSVRNAEGFHRYAKQLHIEEDFPGIQGIGFARRVSESDMTPDSTIYPRGLRGNHFPVVYIYPRHERNRRAVGFNMLSDPERKKAMQVAWETGRPVASGMVKPVQGRDKQPGFELYLPYYENGVIPATRDERREKLEGFVYASFRVNDFLRGVLGDELDPHISFTLYDGQVSQRNLMHDSSEFLVPLPAGYKPTLSTTLSLPIVGRQWIFAFRTRPAFHGEPQRGAASGVLLSGVIITLLGGAFANHRQRARERHLAQQKSISDHEEWLRVTLSSIADGVIAADKDGLVSFINPIASQLTGWSEHEAVGRPLESVVSLLEEGTRKTIRLNSAPGDPNERHEVVAGLLIHRDGRETIVENSIAPILGADGRAQGIVVVLHDVSTARRMKDEFLATLSHELRTPLNAILGWAQLARRRGADPQSVSQGLDIIERNARAQAKIIDDLLDMNRIISGKIRLDMRDTDIREVLADSIETVRPAARAKEIALVTSFDSAAGGLVRGDRQRLGQVFWNLLSNAVKFTPRGGRIELKVSTQQNQLHVAVKDSGEGIKPEFLPYVFERFRQADASTTRRHGGLGLGLAIAKNLIELHGGVVSANSGGQGKGSEFTVTLPLVSSRFTALTMYSGLAVRGETRDIAERADLHGLKILVVDDQEDALELVREVLEEAGAVVITADSAQQGIAMFLHHAPDLLISDIGMPEVDGYQFLIEIRRLSDRGATIPAVALTAFARSEDKAAALSVGYQVHVAKPVQPNELLSIVSRLSQKVREPAAA